MKMKHLYFCLKQLEHVGGTETVTVEIINMLVDYYKISIIVTFSTSKKNIVYKIDPRVEIIFLNIPFALSEYANNANFYLAHLHFIKYLKLNLSLFNHFLIKRKKYQKQLSSYLSNDSIMIFSSIENYYLAPKSGKKLFHFHFNSSNFFSFITQLGLFCSTKPDKYIFLSKQTYEKIVLKRKKLSSSIYITNPCRFKSTKNFSFHNNTISFIGRFSEQKDPLLALKIIKELKEKTTSFHINFYGEGVLKNQMETYIKFHKLNEFVSIYPPSKDVKDVLLNTDLLLMTSKYEGVPLIRMEANKLSVPTISSNWGEPVYDLIKNDINGYIVNSSKVEDFVDILNQLLTNKDRLTKLKETTYENSLDYSNQKILNKWIEEINKLN